MSLKKHFLVYKFALATLLSLISDNALADLQSAQQAMEDSQNPLLLLSTSQGEIYVELFPAEAPNNVANFMALAAGEIEFISTESGVETSSWPHYFNGMRFHRVVPGFAIQAGSPFFHLLGAPAETFADEINADFLGLDREFALNPDGSFNSLLNISDQDDFKNKILLPLYRKMGIEDEKDLITRQYDILAQLQELTVKAAYQNQGYSYRSNRPGRGISRGIMALANTGPDSNGPEFFISLAQADSLNGRYTVIGKVVEGLDVVDTIGKTAIDSLRFSRLSTLIYSVRRVN